MQKQNRDFICPVCGKHDLVPSEVMLKARYGSNHDGEQEVIQICGACIDGFFDAIQLNKRKDDVQQ